MKRMRFVLARQPWRGGFCLWIGAELGLDRMAVASNVIFTDMSEGEALPLDPTLTMTHDDARQLMDELWALGIRPSGQISSEGERSAMQEHIKDLRRLLPPAPPAEGLQCTN